MSTLKHLQTWASRPSDFTDEVKLRRSRKPNRPRKSGIVGPEPDWEVIYSNVPFKALYRYFDICEFSHMQPLFPRDGVYWSPKGMQHTSGMRASHVLAWTRWAHSVGVRFQGNADYVFPKVGPEEKVRYVPFKHIVRHRKAGETKGPRPFKSPVYWRKPTSKEVRNLWYHTKEKSTFKEHASRCKPTQRLVNQPKVDVPDIVIRSLNRIYARSSGRTLPVLRKNWQGQKPPREQRIAAWNAAKLQAEEYTQQLKTAVIRTRLVSRQSRLLMEFQSASAAAEFHLRGVEEFGFYYSDLVRLSSEELDEIMQKALDELGAHIHLQKTENKGLVKNPDTIRWFIRHLQDVCNHRDAVNRGFSVIDF